MNTFCMTFVVLSALIISGCKDSNTTTPQAATGSIQGVVTNDSGAVIEGALIATNPASSTVITNNKGAYTIPDATPGNYVVSATKSPELIGSTNTVVSDGASVTANIVLKGTSGNRPPEIPKNPLPKDSVILHKQKTTTFSWECTDPDNDALVYDVRLGKKPVLTNADNIAVKQTQRTLVRDGLDTGVVYYWQVTARDARGHVKNSPVWSFKVVDADFAIVVNEDYLSVPPNEKLNLSGGSFTLEAWIKPSDFSGIGFFWILDKGNSNGLMDYLVGIDRFYKNGRLRFITRSLANDITGTTVLDTGQWYHIAVVQDVEQAKVRLYVNGILENEATLQGSRVINNDSLMIAGRFGATGIPGEYFHGALDEIRIWNVARTQAQIQDNMTKYISYTQKGLVAYWGFNEGSTSRINDKTANELHGNIIGNPEWIESRLPLK